MLTIRKLKKYYRGIGLRGLLYLLKAKITGKEIFYKRDADDCIHPFWLRLPSTDVFICNQIFGEKQYEFDVKENPQFIVDAGANIGLAAIYFAHTYPNAKIIALEPESSNFQLLLKNTEPYTNIIPIHAALWNKNEEINVIDAGIGKWGFETEDKGISGKQSESLCQAVPALTVDRIMRDHNLPKIDILKIDIEGAEREVFEDTSGWIADIDSIIIELHEDRRSGCNRSFYCGSTGFDREWQRGENLYLSKGNCLIPKGTGA